MTAVAALCYAQAMSEKLTAVVWDFDGTLVDTRQKNLNVTRTLVELVRGVAADSCEALRSLVHYERAVQRTHDWQTFYADELGMSAAQVADAGGRWAEFQKIDETAAFAYDGVPDVLNQLAHMPQGIVSLNSKPNILRFLERLALSDLFGEVIGYEAFEPQHHKPAPFALVACIDSLTGLRPGKVVYVGDHETDIECVHNTNQHFARTGIDIEVLGVSAQYAPLADDTGWSAQPHFRAAAPDQILEFIDRLAAAVPAAP